MAKMYHEADIKRVLQSYSMSILRDMVELLHIASPPNGKDAYIKALTSFLFTPDALQRGFAQLGAREKEALLALLNAGGRMEANRLHALLLHQGTIEPQEAPASSQLRETRAGSVPRSYNVFVPERGRTSFPVVIGRLIASGLICGEGASQQSAALATDHAEHEPMQPIGGPSYIAVYYDNVQELVIPDPVHAWLLRVKRADEPVHSESSQEPVPDKARGSPPHGRLAPIPLPDRTASSIESVSQRLTYVAESSARSFQRDLYLYWSTVRTHPLSLTKQRRLYRKDLRLVNAALLQPEDLGATGDSSEEAARDEPDVPRLLFLRLLLTDMGLLKQDGHTVRAVDRLAFLEQEPAERIRETFVRWRDSTFWNEILSVPRVTIREAGQRTDPAPQPIVRARQKVLQHIAGLHRAKSEQAPFEHGGPWMAVDELIDYIRQHDYHFLLPRDYGPRVLRTYPLSTYQRYLSRPSPYISYGNEMAWSFSPPFYDESEGWEVIEAGFISAILLEPLYWMGLVDIGFADDDLRAQFVRRTPSGRRTSRAYAYRLTPIGAWMLDVGPPVDIPEEEGRVVVQPNFEVFALDPVSDRTLSLLDEFADRISAERAIKYRLTRESVYRAQRRGWTVACIIKTLERLMQAGSTYRQENSGTHVEHESRIDVEGQATPDAGRPPQSYALPQNVARTLEEWQRLHERVTVHRRASLLQAADAGLLQRLLEDEIIRSHLAPSAAEALPSGSEKAGPAAVRVSSRFGETEVLVHALQRIGYPPARTRFFRDGTPPVFSPIQCIEIQEGGRGQASTEITFTIPLPSFYVLEQLAPFTGRDEQGRIFLTQSAVQEAVERGMSIQEILNRLRTLHRGPLPRWVETQLRAWSHYYGNVVVQTVTLVQFRDQQTLDELLSEPEFTDLLRPFQPVAGKALAVVVTQDLQALYQALAERGIDVQETLVL